MDILTIMLDHRTKVDLGRYSLAPTINYAIDYIRDGVILFENQLS